MKTFHARGHLITTPVFQYYHRRGLKLTNVEYVIQYSRDRPLAEFVNKMTECRIKATRDKQEELAQLFKVFDSLINIRQIIYRLL